MIVKRVANQSGVLSKRPPAFDTLHWDLSPVGLVKRFHCEYRNVTEMYVRQQLSSARIQARGIETYDKAVGILIQVRERILDGRKDTELLAHPVASIKFAESIAGIRVSDQHKMLSRVMVIQHAGHPTPDGERVDCENPVGGRKQEPAWLYRGPECENSVNK